MKNLLNLIALTTLLFFASCSKEAILEPQTLNVEKTETAAEAFSETKNTTPTITVNDAVIQINVEKITATATAGEYFVGFSSTHDFSNEILEANQDLDFTDQNGNETTLSFTVNSSNGGAGWLEVTFSIGGNDLSGLDLKSQQKIVTEDIVID